MSDFERLSITVAKSHAAKVKELVERGLYPSVSRAFDAAVEMLIEQEVERDAWASEISRRCDEAEASPGSMLSADDFHRRLWDRIAERKRALGLPVS